MAAETNIYIDQGTDFLKTVTIAGADGNLVNITGYQVKSQMRKYYGSSTGYTFNSGIQSLQESKIFISLDKDQSAAVPGGRFFYDVDIISPEGERMRVLEGVATVTPQITRI